MSVYTHSVRRRPDRRHRQSKFCRRRRPDRRDADPADSVEEFKVNTAGQTADFNSSAGAEVQGRHQARHELLPRHAPTNIIWTTTGRRTPGTTTLHGTQAPELPLQPLWRTPSAGRSSRRRFWAARPISSSTMKASASRTPKPSKETFPPPPCAWALLTPRRRNLQPEQCPGDLQRHPYPRCECTAANDLQVAFAIRAGSESTRWCRRCGARTSQHPMHGLRSILLRWREHSGYSGQCAPAADQQLRVVRVDHDFGDKWHFMASYRYFKLSMPPTTRSTSAVSSRAISWACPLPSPAIRSSLGISVAA